LEGNTFPTYENNLKNKPIANKTTGFPIKKPPQKQWLKIKSNYKYVPL